MKSRLNLILAAVVVALAAYTFLFEVKKPEQEKQKKEKDSQILTLLPDQIQTVILDRKIDVIELQRDETGWSFVRPFIDRADNISVEDFIQSLHREKYFDVVEAPAGGSLDMKTFGFDAPMAKLEFVDNQKEKNIFIISDKKNFEGNSFLRKEGDPRIFIVNTLWQSTSLRDMNDFRDRRLFQGAISSIDEISMKNKSGSFQLKMTDGHWKLIDEPDVIVDQNQVRTFLSSLSDSKYHQWLGSTKGSLADMKNRGFDRPLAELSLKTPDKMYQIVFGQDSQKVFFVFMNEPSTVASLLQFVVDKFTNSTRTDFRDKTNAFSFESQSVRRIKYQGKLKAFDFDFASAPEEFSSFLKIFKESRVSIFEPKLKVGKVQHQFSFLNEAGVVIFHVDIGDHAVRDGKKYFVVQTPLEKSPFLLSELVFNSIKGHSFFKQDQTQQNSTEQKVEDKHPEGQGL